MRDIESYYLVCCCYKRHYHDVNACACGQKPPKHTAVAAANPVNPAVGQALDEKLLETVPHLPPVGSARRTRRLVVTPHPRVKVKRVRRSHQNSEVRLTRTRRPDHGTMPPSSWSAAHPLHLGSPLMEVIFVVTAVTYFATEWPEMMTV